MATARSASAAKLDGSTLVEETIAAFLPTKTRRPRSRPSERSSCSVCPSRRSTPALMPETTTASAASAPAPRAALMRSASRSRSLMRRACPRWPAKRGRVRRGRAPRGSGRRGTRGPRRGAMSAVVTASILATVSAVGIRRPNTWSWRASCSQRLPVLSSDISSDAFTCARARASSASDTLACTLRNSSRVTGTSSPASFSPVPA